MRQLVDCAPDAIIVADNRGLIQRANPQVQTLLGYSPTELEGMALSELMPASTAQHHAHYMAGYDSGLRGMTAEGRQVQARRRDGSLVVVHVRVSEMPFRGGRSFVGFLRDMTPQYQERAALAEREQQFREVLAASADGFWLCDLEGRLLDVNEAYVRRSGYAREALLRMSVADLLARDTPAGVAARIADIVRKGRETFEATHRAQDGSTWRAEVSVTYSPMAGQRLFTFVRDITERKLAEAALRRSEDKLRKLFDLSPLGIALTELDGRFLEFNNAFVALFDRDADTLRQLRHGDVTAPGYEADAERDLRTLARTGRYGPCDREYLHRDGRRVPVRLNGVRISLGGRACIWSIAEDLTERRRAGIERERLQRQLMQAQKMEALGQLTGGIAHDFNNMLAGILGLSTLALERLVSDPQSKLALYLREITKVSERGRDLIGKMMSFSRPEGQQPAQVGALAPAVQDVLHMLRPAMPSRIELTLALDPNLPQVRFTEVDVHQILTNLLINARDAIRDEGQVQVGLQRRFCLGDECASCGDRVQGEHLALIVCDDGVGIEPEVLPRIFDPFFTTKDVGKGTGLGLAMVHSLVHKAGGHVLMDSRRGEGTTVTLLLPVADLPVPPEVDPGLLPGPGALPAPVLAGATGQRIWVVDDDPTVLVFLFDLLQGLGHCVTSFSDPLLARQALLRDPMALDCLLTDQTMPHLSGADLARAALALRPALPVILCTGYSDRIDEAGALALGVQHFLRKPFEVQALVAALTPHASAVA